MTCMKIESSFLHFEKQAPKILQEETLEGYKFEANSFIEEGVLATMDEGLKRRSQASLMSLAGL